MTEIKQFDNDRTMLCPRCRHVNNADCFFCYSCGKYFVDSEDLKTGSALVKSRRAAKSSSPARAKIVMPGGNEILLADAPVFIERSDFDSTLPHDLLMCISRQHVLITCNKSKYYVQDYGREGKGSTNHTRVNGVDIFSKKKKALKDGDRIELANQPELTMMFKLIQDRE
jgi:pSer/pThr/pTyr-binding forkhead associated (FHA) protein